MRISLDEYRGGPLEAIQVSGITVGDLVRVTAITATPVTGQPGIWDVQFTVQKVYTGSGVK